MGQFDGWIAVFREGAYPQGDFGRETVAEVAQTYDPAWHEAPITVGHPKTADGRPDESAPAYGWVKGLRLRGGVLEARFGQVAPEFEDWVKRGLYRKRSVRLSRNIHPEGKWYLRDVGWLGAAAPAVKGLPDAAMSGAEGHIEIEFAEENMDGKQEEEKRETKPPAEGEYQCAEDAGGTPALPGEAGAPMQRQDAAATNAQAEARATMNQQQDAAATKTKEAKAEFAEMGEAEKLKAEVAALKRELRRKEAEARLEKLSAEGRVTPAMMKLGLAEFMATEDDAAEAEFAGGEKATRAGFMWSLLQALPPAVEFGERGFAARAAGSEPAPKEFAGSDPERLKMYQKAKQVQSEKGCTFREALAMLGEKTE